MVSHGSAQLVGHAGRMSDCGAAIGGGMAHHDHAGTSERRTKRAMLTRRGACVGITEIAERLGLAVLDQAATKAMSVPSIPTVILSLVAGAGVKYLERAKVGRGCWFDPAIGGESQAVLRRNHPSCALVRQRIGISRNPRRRSVHTAHLVLMRVSHHRQRDRQVDPLLDPVEDPGGLVIGPCGIDHQHAAAIPDDQTVARLAPKPGMSR